jgi:hypothetical protein
MAGLNDIITNKATQTTTLPSWFDTAQKKVVTDATTAATSAPTPANTVAQNAVTRLEGTTNPFSTATDTVQKIASGAANPFIVNQQTGAVTPDTSTALGGLFQAQNQQLNQLMPNIIAPVTGASIGSGNFGSLRGETAANKAMADAQAQLFSQQMQAALNNQSTGVNAAATAGNLTNQEIKSLLETGQYEQAAPFINASNFAKIIGSVTAPTTVNNQTQLSPLNQIGGLISLLGGADGKSGVLKSLGIEGGLGGLGRGITDFIKSIGSGGGGGGGVVNTGTGEDFNMGGGDVYVPGTGSGGGNYIPNPDPNLDNRDVEPYYG